MQILKWCVVPLLILLSALAFMFSGWFESTWVSAVFGVFAVVSIVLWRRATYRLAGSVKNMDQDNFNPDESKVFNAILTIAFSISLVITLSTLVVVVCVPAVRTVSGLTFAFIAIAWCSIVKFGFANILTHYWLPMRRSI